MRKNRKTTKHIHGIIVNDLKVNIFELKKQYEVHVIFKDKDDIEERLDKTIDYLSQEGYFDKKKDIKVIGMSFNKKESIDDNSFFSSDDE